jgi:hypothetical protein
MQQDNQKHLNFGSGPTRVSIAASLRRASQIGNKNKQVFHVDRRKKYFSQESHKNESEVIISTTFRIFD